MIRLNCWQYRRCGREPGGENVSELGICNAALPSKNDLVNHGKNSGRICWTIADTKCDGEPTCKILDDINTCLTCEFLKYVTQQERQKFILFPEEKTYQIVNNQ